MIKLTEQIAQLQQQAQEKLEVLIEAHGVESEHSSQTVLKVKGDNNMVNLEGSRYLTEIGAETLKDDEGYEYSHDVISLEDFCQILDNQEFQYQ